MRTERVTQQSLFGLITTETKQQNLLSKYTHQLQVLAECLVKLGVVVLVLGNLSEHLQALLHDVLLDHLWVVIEWVREEQSDYFLLLELQCNATVSRDTSETVHLKTAADAESLFSYLQNLVLLQGLTGDVEGQVLAVHDTLHSRAQKIDMSGAQQTEESTK